MAVRRANAVWEGDLRKGNGTIKSESGALDGKVTYASRFEEGAGTNPDELLGAALASCFSMALANKLASAGHAPERLETEARVHLQKGDSGFQITRIELVLEGRVPGMERAAFLEHAQDAKRTCPVSQTLTGTEIRLDATLRE